MNINEIIARVSQDFDNLCQERHNVGASEYGQFTFLENDVVRMMMEELADTANYCRMQFIKLMILQGALEEQVNTETGMTLGMEAFRGAGKVGWVKD